MSKAIRQAIQQSILDSIRQQALSVGDRIPTETELAKQFATSRSNVHLAIKALQHEGFVKRYQRRGTFVARMVPQQHAATRPGRPVRVRPKLHVLAAAKPEHMSMHWGDDALHQLERMVHSQGLQLVQKTLSAPLQVAQLGDLTAQLVDEGSEALVILAELPGSDREDAYAETLLQCVNELAAYPGRVCLLNRSGFGLAGWPYDSVSLDPLGEGMRVGRYLREHRVSRVICLAYRSRIWGRLRARGIEMSLQPSRTDQREQPGKDPIPYEITWFEAGDDLDALFSQVLDDIERQRDRPTVILPKDALGARFIDLAKERGLACPDAYCIISFNNDMRYRAYNMTTVAPLVESIGDVIGQLTCNRINRPTSSSLNITLKSTIIERTTFATDSEPNR